MIRLVPIGIFFVLSVTKERLQLLSIVMEKEQFILVTLAALEMKSIFSHVRIHVLHPVHIQMMLVSFVEVCHTTIKHAYYFCNIS